MDAMFNHSKKSVLIWLIITCVAVIVNILYVASYNNKTDAEIVTEKLQKKLWHKDIMLSNEVNKFAGALENDTAKDLLMQLYNMPKPDDDLAIFVYHNNALIFWTTNQINVEKEVDSLVTEQYLVKKNNGWYIKQIVHKDQFVVLGYALVKHDYQYKNKYLPGTFNEDFNMWINPGISYIETDHPVYDKTGKYLFSLDFSNVMNEVSFANFILLYLFLFLLIAVVALLFYLHKIINPFKKYKNIYLIFFVLDVIIIRLAIYWFKFPSILHNTKLFGPDYFASSLMHASLGDLLINVLLLFLVILFIYNHWKPTFKKEKYSQGFIALMNTLGFVVFTIAFFLLMQLVQLLLVNSTLDLNLNNLFSFDNQSYLGLAVVVFATLSVLLVFVLINSFLRQFEQKTLLLLPAVLIAFPLIIILLYLQFSTVNWLIVILFSLFIVLFFLYNNSIIRPVYITMIAVVLLTIFLTYLLNVGVAQKEKEKRIIITEQLADKTDPMAEFLFADIKSDIYQDTALAVLIFDSVANEDLISTYILQKYFGPSRSCWNKYNMQITICNPYHNLIIQPSDQVINCHEFFESQIKESGRMTSCANLFYMEDVLGFTNYIGILTFDNTLMADNSPIKIFIEIFPKLAPADVGYLELLVDDDQLLESEIHKYSHARYVKNKLVNSFGKYFYSINVSKYGPVEGKYQFFDHDNYSHLYYKVNDNVVLMVSTKKKSMLDSIAPFSYLLIIFLLIIGAYSLLKAIRKTDSEIRSNFKNRLQISMLAVIVISFVFIGSISIYYIRSLNRDKNYDNLKDKARSIRIEVEHKLSNEESLTSPEMREYIQSLLVKFNDVFATDINLFDLQGDLIASSRYPVFDNGLLSEKMNAEAFHQMARNKQTLLINEETIGELSYLSAYVPFRNQNNNVIAYLNLPYFAKQNELSNEISDFLMAFVNVYIILIILTIVITFFISSYIAKPLQLIRNKIKAIRLGKSNEKIDWHGNDEIGQLVSEYNRMIDELAKSSELLAKSERESAWREMARQIAHEIKNPLTPMKLSLQYLQKTWEEKTPGWDKKFEKFSNNLVEQIESLSKIATEFSNFANMPKLSLEKVEVDKVISNAINLFDKYDAITIEYHSKTEDNIVVADKEQLNSVFINLIKNAIQAKKPNQEMKINITVESIEEQIKIIVEDNGTGIPDHLHNKIFAPNFTTKSSGMGLGLAIVKNTIESIGGSISYISQIDSGTAFIILLPKA